MIDSQTFSFTLADLIAKQASIQPLAIAIADNSKILNYVDFNSRANRLANYLTREGIGRGDVIAILSENRSEYLEVELAAAKLGVVLSCLNWRVGEEELRHCLGLAEPKLTFVSERYTERLTALLGESAPVLAFGSDYETSLSQADDRAPDAQPEPEDPLLILYTSGTTGAPKGAVITQRALVWRLVLFLSEAGVTRDEAFVAWCPLFHMAGSDYCLATLMLGGKVILTDGFDLEAMIRAIETEILGYLPVVTGMIDRLIQVLKERRVKPRSIRIIGAMADLVPPEQLAEITTLLDAPFMNSFGMTEVGTAPASGNQIPVGVCPKVFSKRESTFCLVRLVDEQGNDVPEGEPGEIVVRGPSLFSGYWKAPEATAKAFEGGWYHTGDVLRRNAEGSLDFVERLTFMIKSGGENIYPSEIERALLSDDRVTEACVVPMRDDKWGEVPVAFVAVRDDNISAQELIDRCGEMLGRFKRPKQVRFVQADSFPRNAAGKIIKRTVREWLTQETA